MVGLRQGHIAGLARAERRTEILRQRPFIVGEIRTFAFSTVPTGWLKCDGSAVSRTYYSELFSAIGTTFGVGDGSTTFNLPDLVGNFVRGSGTVGSTGGSADAVTVAHVHTMPSHDHTINPPNTSTTSNGTHGHGQVDGRQSLQRQTTGSDGISLVGGPDTYTWHTWDDDNSPGGSHSHTVDIAAFDSENVDPGDTNSTGSSGTGANLPPYLDLLQCIYTG